MNDAEKLGFVPPGVTLAESNQLPHGIMQAVLLRADAVLPEAQ